MRPQSGQLRQHRHLARYTSFCGYHSFIGTARARSEILYTDLPSAFNISGCDTNLAFGTGYANSDAIDPVVGILEPEASETMTDPNLTARFQDGGTDNGFEMATSVPACMRNGGFGSLSGLSNNGLGFFNYALSSDRYLMQLE